MNSVKLRKNVIASKKKIKFLNFVKIKNDNLTYFAGFLIQVRALVYFSTSNLSSSPGSDTSTESLAAPQAFRVAFKSLSGKNDIARR